MACRFITFEGADCAGKSTQARLLAAALARAGHAVLATREPGGAPGAERLRDFLLAMPAGFDPTGEALLHFAARADHVARTLRPALVAGLIVVCDRFFDSTMAYQGYGQGADRTIISRLTAALNLVPDLTLILDLPRIEGRRRLAARKRGTDRYELLGDPFLARVQRGFREIAFAHPERCVIVDGTGEAALVHQRILAIVEARLS